MTTSPVAGRHPCLITRDPPGAPGGDPWPLRQRSRGRWRALRGLPFCCLSPSSSSPAPGASLTRTPPFSP
eukprot:6260-Pyramimonas_sp.AAC.1